MRKCYEGKSTERKQRWGMEKKEETRWCPKDPTQSKKKSKYSGVNLPFCLSYQLCGFSEIT